VAYARAVTFEGVDRNRIDQLTQQLQSDERPEDIPATEIILLYDADGEKSLVVVFFENEDDYRRGDAALNAMDPGETPGKRTSVTKYEVAVRRSE
jgi:hypothetical protein